MNKNILFIGSFLSAHRGTKGPSEQIATELAKNGYSVSLASTCNNRYLRLIDTIIKLLLFKGKWVCIDVYSGSAFKIAEIASIIAKIKKHKLLLTLHGGRLPEFFQHHQNKISLLFSRATVIQSPSHYLIQALNTSGFKIQYVPNPIHLNTFTFNRNNVKPYTILWVRAFDNIYNPEIAIQVVAALTKKWPFVTLTMVGPDLGKLAEIKVLCDQLNVSEKVVFTGAIPNNQLHQYYQTHAVYINTTSYESFGVSLLEAAACGIPIVSNSVGEIPLMWQQPENINLVHNNAINEFVSSISALFESTALGNLQSLNARKKAEEFNINTILSTWYKTLL